MSKPKTKLPRTLSMEDTYKGKKLLELSLEDRAQAGEAWNKIVYATVSCHLDAEEDVPVLYKYASQLKLGEIYLEIGTWMGGSAILGALASPHGVEIWTIDSGTHHEKHWRHTPQEYRDILNANFERCQVAEKIKVSLDGSLDTPWSDPIQLLFIDGNHKGWAVRADIKKWTPFVLAGGIVLFHDYSLYGGVKHPVDELMQEGWQRIPGASNMIAFKRIEQA